MPQEAAILKRLRRAGNPRRRIGKSELLRLLNRAVPAEIHERS